MKGGHTHTMPVQLRFRDTDRFGHVNNAVFASYSELARVDFMYGLEPPPPGLILARIEIDFRRQLHLGARVEIATNVARIGRTSVALAQRLIADDQLVADIGNVVVIYDYAGQEMVEVSPELRAALEAYVLTEAEGG